LIQKEREVGKAMFGSILTGPVLIALFLLPFSLLMVSHDEASAKRPPKELPMLVTVGDLIDDPGQYDGHRVVVNGHVRSIEMQRGRRGSEYIFLVLEEVDAPDPKGPTVSVISLTLPPVRRGNKALVQGVYHREGNQAGKPFENFIDAEVILRE
jgi:hypothetical protein